MEHDQDFVLVKSQSLRDRRVEDVLHVLNFQKMVPRTERSHLRQPALFRPVTDRCRVGVVDGAILLASVQVFRPAVTVLDHPGGAVFEQPVELLVREPDIPALAYARGNVTEELVHQLLDLRPNLVERQRTGKQPHATVDIKSHSTG